MFFRKKVITRFAPSPTGFMHVGSLRTALYNYLFAKKNKGKFYLRIEDTDQARKVEGAADNLQEMLKLFDLNPDNKKPMVQSERLDIYHQAVKKLISGKKAYYCFCTKERLEELKATQEKNKQAPMYDGYCKNISEQEVNTNLAEKKSRVVRFVTPDAGQTSFVDLVRGQVNFENKLIDDQIILKSDNFPTYHLASVVDDNEMKITHVIRGEEWLPSTPKHILIYQALDYKIPQFAHLPLLLNKDKSKLSKRQGDVSVEQYLDKGYLKESLLNFLLLLGWNPGTEQEIFNFSEMIKQFDIAKINKAGAIFNTEKLDWLNGNYIRKTPSDQLTKLAIPYLVKNGLLTPQYNNQEINEDLTGYLGKIITENFVITNSGKKINFQELSKIITVHREKIHVLTEIAEEISYIFELKTYEKEILIWKKSTNEQTTTNLKEALKIIESIETDNWNSKNLEEVLISFIKQNNLGNGDVLFPLRAALSGRKASPGPFDIAYLLGKPETITRLNKAIKLLEK